MHIRDLILLGMQELLAGDRLQTVSRPCFLVVGGLLVTAVFWPLIPTLDVLLDDLSGVTYYSHPQSQAPVTRKFCSFVATTECSIDFCSFVRLSTHSHSTFRSVRFSPPLVQHTPQSNTHNGSSHSGPTTTNKTQSHGQKASSSQKSQATASSVNQKPKQPLSRLAPNQPTTVKPSATTNAPNAVPPNATPAPTPPGSSAVMAAVMAQAQAAAGQAVAAQQAKQQAPATPAPQGTSQSQSPTHPVQGQPAPPPYPYPYPYYMPPAQPGAPPYIYPGKATAGFVVLSRDIN